MRHEKVTAPRLLKRTNGQIALGGKVARQVNRVVRYVRSTAPRD